MASRCRLDLVNGSQARLVARIVHSEFLPATMNGEWRCFRSEVFGRTLDPHCQDISKVFSKRYFLQHLVHRLMVSPGEFDASCIRLIDQSVFVTLHCKGDAGTC